MSTLTINLVHNEFQKIANNVLDINNFGYIDSDGITINDKHEYKVETGAGENGSNNFRILKKEIK